ncbi:MAG: M23 family metallopeptidase [Hyphomicrobium sp.]
MGVRRNRLMRVAERAFAIEARGRPSSDVFRPELYGVRGAGLIKDMYADDHADPTHGGRFRWMLSTCLAATVGAIAILVVVYGSSDDASSPDGLLPALQSIRDGSAVAAIAPPVKNADGLKWVVPKADRLQLTMGALSTRYIIHESSKSRRDGREYVRQKPYARIVARLAPVGPEVGDAIPPFNPFKLYANNRPVSANDDLDENAGSGLSRSDVQVKVVELLGGILPGEDGQELDAQEVMDLVDRSGDGGEGSAAGAAGEPLDGVAGATDVVEDSGLKDWQPSAATSQQTNTTEILKSVDASDEVADDFEGGEIALVKVGRDDTLTKILGKAGAPTWQARAMVEAAQNTFPESALTPGQEVRITLVPSLTIANAKEPARFSVFSDGHDHLVTVTRNAAGEFVASAQSLISQELQAASGADSEGSPASSVYASVYHAGLTQNLSPETIQQVLRVNAFDTDFRRRVRPGDTLELFFDMKEEQSTEGPPGELLFTAISSGGAVYKYFRFRSGDGVIDYYDADGNNSKKFLMRKPVRGDDVRLTSGYGVRFHPLLNTRKMHTGVDWACGSGTPILAAGNGTIEESGHKGYYGNYIRIRHANGYHTAYGHLSKFASGVTEGVKVRQGQIIGYVGSTGLSSGPHLHFEVLVNSRFVDPMSIEVPRERKLEGKDLGEFQKERARIEELMRRAPVMTANK